VNVLNAAPTRARLSCREVERVVCEIWSRHLGRDVCPYDDFYDLGGDSLTMIDVVAEARELGLPVRSSVALREASPARLAESLTIGSTGQPPSSVALPTLYASARATAQQRAADWNPADGRSVPIVATGTGEPLYVVHSDSHVEAERTAVAEWGGGRPVRGFSLRGVRGLIPPVRTIRDSAAELVRALRAEQAAGPYRLAGFGLGAVLAFEMARQLSDDGMLVALLALIAPSTLDSVAGRDHLLRHRLAMLAARFALTGTENMEETYAQLRADGWYDDGIRPWDLPWLQLAWADAMCAVHAYDPPGYDGPVLLFDGAAEPRTPERGWLRAIREPRIHRLDHGIESPLAVIVDGRVARIMREALAA
jgi:thioesterase domain-containing protein